MSAERELQRQNERLDLLLNLTSRITSSLDLREVLRSIAANIREVILADAVAVGLPDAASGKFRVFAVDFPHGKGVLKEELIATPSAAFKKAMDTLKPVVWEGERAWGTALALPLKAVEDAQSQQQHPHILKPEHGCLGWQVKACQDHVRRK